MAAEFTGRVALITGAAGGLGRAAAIAFARAGAKVCVADINLAGAEETCRLVQQVVEAGAEVAKACQCDVSKSEEVDKLVQFAVDSFGAIHHCFNNAGLEGRRAKIHELSSEDYAYVMNVNAGGIFNCMRAEIKQLLRQAEKENIEGLGESPLMPKAIDRLNYTIVNTSSTAGQSAMPEFSPYSASKHAVIGLTKCAAKEYGSAGIRVNCICPSTTQTPMVQRFTDQWPDWQEKQNSSFPVGRVGTAEEVAQAVLWLSSTACPMACGTALTIDGALSA